MASASPNSNEETELTMCDVLEEEQELEEDANAVLGGSDDTNCSYDKGYVPRQALYACTTCSVNGEGGVCLACCYACHDGHEVVELYTKRNFRCDCGNSKFNAKACTLKPDKDPVNSKNKYNQNFRGLYCSCSRPYPDAEDSTPDEMIQCIMCEDWYHGRHLKVEIPDDYFEMICYNCMGAHEFLYPYLHKLAVKVDSDTGAKMGKTETSPVKTESTSNGLASKDEEIVDVVNLETGEKCHVEQEIKVDKESDIPSVKDEPDVKSETTPVKSESIYNGLATKDEEIIDVKLETGEKFHVEPEVKVDIEADVPSIKNEPDVNSENKACDLSVGTSHPSSSTDKELNLQNGSPRKGLISQLRAKCNGFTADSKIHCVLKSIHVDQAVSSSTAFWPVNWRNELCRCSDCMAMYEKLQCLYLLNPDDTIQAYEERGKGGSKETQYDRGLSALSRLDRVKQMEAVRAYTNMKGELKEYLKQFAENKRTVCESDIKEFFERMGKKQKLNNGVPYFCR